MSGLVKIEWEIGKSRADRIIIHIFAKVVIFILNYLELFKKNYKTYRQKIKIKNFNEINLGRFFYPFLIFFILPPLVFALLFNQYIPEWAYIIFGIIYFVVAALYIFGFLFYLIIRMLLDPVIILACLTQSFFSTTITMTRRLLKK